jgi:hypothetical protein
LSLKLDQEMPKSKVVDEDVDGVPLDEDLDGAPLSDSEDLDGVPLDGAALLRSAVKLKSDPSPPTVSQPPPVSRRLKMSKYVDDGVDGEPSKFSFHRIIQMNPFSATTSRLEKSSLRKNVLASDLSFV